MKCPPARIALFLLASCSMLLLNSLQAEEKKPTWKPLMDGKTLAGWHKIGEGEWTVEDGAFVGRANKTKLYGLLVSDDVYGDFTVRLKFKCRSGDSGFYIRTVIEKTDQAHGLQVQVGRPDSGNGGIYESYGRQWLDKPTAEQEKKNYREENWNEMTIAAHGGNIIVRLNGVQTAKLKNDPSRPKGRFALQMHSGTVMEILFKDIEILDE